jgi:serine/threonine protein kinase, bacterial
MSVCQRGHRIRRMVLSEASVTTVAGDGVVGSSNGIGKHARFSAPSSVHLIYGSKLLLIADRDNHQLRLMDTFSSVVTTVVGSGSAGYADGIGTMVTLSAPHFIAVSSRNVFAVVSDVGSHCLRMVVLSTWSVSTLAGSSTGAKGFVDGLGTLALFKELLCFLRTTVIYLWLMVATTTYVG